MNLCISWHGERVLPAIAALQKSVGLTQDDANRIVNHARGPGVMIQGPVEKLKKIIETMVGHCDATSFSYLMREEPWRTNLHPEVYLT